LLNDLNLKEFYDQNPFPGPYTLSQLTYGDTLPNRYLAQIDQYLDHGQTVLDIGCGTGLVSNLFATRYRSDFVGIDFSTAADYAQQFANENTITNARFVKQDFFEYTSSQTFDVVICQSVITHVADDVAAMRKINSLMHPGATLLIGVYNNWGNWAKKTWPSKGNDRLHLDQYQCPFEVAHSHQQVLQLCEGMTMLSVIPSVNNQLVALCSLFNKANGGLTLYAFQKK
jgi:2-polyprenyl-3-methyl-5-hydroxy-6-metoxy-1,4-benzoquinol methylase